MGNLYAEWVPVRPLAGVVLCGWSRTVERRPEPYRIVPDGCTDLIWDGSALFVAGPDSEAQLMPIAESRSLTGLRFAPGFAPAVFGVPAEELANGRPDLAEISPRLAGFAPELVDRLHAADRPDLVLQRAAATVLRRELLDPALPAMVAGLRRGCGVAELADDLGMAERSLQRRCRAAFGYGPKVTQRVLRFDRAVRLAQRGRAFAEIAAVTGYADQAHLAREVRVLAGVPLSGLLDPDPG